MNDLEKKAADKEEIISKIYDDIEREKEQKIVNRNHGVHYIKTSL